MKNFRNCHSRVGGSQSEAETGKANLFSYGKKIPAYAGMTALLISLLLPTLAFAQTLTPTSFDNVKGWRSVNHEGAFLALREHCEKGGVPKATGDIYTKENWERTCKATAREYANQKLRNKKHFFTEYFTPMLAKRTDGKNGFLTGYFIPELEARLKKGGAFQYPAYALPPNANDRTLPRATIEQGALNGKGLELAWFKDPIDLFFMQVQGSGFIRLGDGSRKQLAFAGTNDLPYTSIGKIVIDQGYIAKEKVDYKTLRGWLKENRILAREIMPENARFVYFTLKNATDIKGAANVPLTARHSLAVDPAHLPYGVPVFLSRASHADVYDDSALPDHFLTITGDTGAAIKGELRGDVYFGAGENAETLAGMMRHRAEWVVLVPR